MSGRISQKQFVLNWFSENRGRDISSSEAKASIEALWLDEFGTRIEDADRPIRGLAAVGLLQKIGKGVYRFNDSPSKTERHGFGLITTNAIFARDDFSCVFCVDAPRTAIELFVGRVYGGRTGSGNELSDGITLCARHFISHTFSNEAEAKRILFKEIQNRSLSLTVDQKLSLTKVVDVLVLELDQIEILNLSSLAKKLQS